MLLMDLVCVCACVCETRKGDKKYNYVQLNNIITYFFNHGPISHT